MENIWWVVFIISLLNFVALTGFVFPKIFFKVTSNFSYSFDRGLKNYKEKEGRTIVYSPHPKYQKYVKQYIISERNNKKSVLCKIDPNLTYVDYDIALFDCNDKVFAVLNFKESIVKPGYTSVAELPPQTMYATLIVNGADNIWVNIRNLGKTSRRTSALFIIVSGLFTVFQVFVFQTCFAGLFGDVFTDNFLTSAQSFFITLSLGLLVEAVSFALVFIYIRLRNQKKSGNVKT